MLCADATAVIFVVEDFQTAMLKAADHRKDDTVTIVSCQCNCSDRSSILSCAGPGLQPKVALGNLSEAAHSCRHAKSHRQAWELVRMVMRALTRLRGVWRSFLRHSGLAEPGEVRGFVQCLDFRHSPIGGRPETGDARIAIISAQSPGLGELRIGAPGFAHQSIGGGEKSAGAGMFGI